MDGSIQFDRRYRVGRGEWHHRGDGVYHRFGNVGARLGIAQDVQAAGNEYSGEERARERPNGLHGFSLENPHPEGESRPQKGREAGGNFLRPSPSWR